MDIIRVNINSRKTLNKLGYDSNNYYCGNYSMQKYYSYIYRFLQKLGVTFALNRACFIHDLNYCKKPTISQKFKIDWIFFKDMLKSIWYEYKTAKSISAKHAYYLIPVACLFYLIVVVCTPFYVRQGKIQKNK